MNHDKNIWMAIKAIALDSGFYRRYIWKGEASKPEEFEGIQIQIKSPRQDALWIEPDKCDNLELLDCHNISDLSKPN